jgi:hypothetical protein
VDPFLVPFEALPDHAQRNELNAVYKASPARGRANETAP